MTTTFLSYRRYSSHQPVRYPRGSWYSRAEIPSRSGLPSARPSTERSRGFVAPVAKTTASYCAFNSSALISLPTSIPVLKVIPSSASRSTGAVPHPYRVSCWECHTLTNHQYGHLAHKRLHDALPGLTVPHKKAPPDRSNHGNRLIGANFWRLSDHPTHFKPFIDNRTLIIVNRNSGLVDR